MRREQCPALPFRHPTPDAEFDSIVECVRTAFHQHRAVPAEGGGFALRGACDEELIRVSFSTLSPRYPAEVCCGVCEVVTPVRFAHVEPSHLEDRAQSGHWECGHGPMDRVKGSVADRFSQRLGSGDEVRSTIAPLTD
jgi:hypothetical protein